MAIFLQLWILHKYERATIYEKCAVRRGYYKISRSFGSGWSGSYINSDFVWKGITFTGASVAFTSRSSPGDARECTRTSVSRTLAHTQPAFAHLHSVEMDINALRAGREQGGGKGHIPSNFKSRLMHARWPRFRECYKCCQHPCISSDAKLAAAGLKSTPRDHAR